MHLTVNRAGQRLVDKPITVCCQPSGDKAVHVRDVLDGDGEPEVWVDASGRGAHTAACSWRLRRFRERRVQEQEQVFELRLPAQGPRRRWHSRVQDQRLRLLLRVTYFAASPFPFASSGIAPAPSPTSLRNTAGSCARTGTSTDGCIGRASAITSRRSAPLAGWTADEYLLGHRPPGQPAPDPRAARRAPVQRRRLSPWAHVIRRASRPAFTPAATGHRRRHVVDPSPP